MAEHKIQDDILLILKAQEVVVHENVRVNVGITAQVDQSKSEKDFRTEIQTTLKKFIDTEWKIQSVNRQKGANRFETVYVQATARVPEKENYQLAERATALSRISFELINPYVDYSLTFDEVQAVNEKLRLRLLNMALAETQAINTAFRQAASGPKSAVPEFRVSSTRFDRQDGNFVTPGMYAMNNVTGGATVAANAVFQATALNDPAEYEEAVSAMPLDGGSSDLNVSTRFEMTGTFTLRRLVN